MITSTRRALLSGAGAWSAAGLLAGKWSGPAEAWEPQVLRIPELIDARREGQSVALQVQRGETSFFPNRQTSTLGYNGSHLGPTLRLHSGDETEMVVTNQLQEDTTVHWHGLIIPGPADGGPHQLIRPGSTWRPRLKVKQPAATLMYHSHVHGSTAEQVYAGLAGVLLVADDAERALGLPSEYGLDDLPLVLQDRIFDQGRLVYPNNHMAMMLGVRGDTILVNGTVQPVARVPGRLVRLRLVNASNARIYDLSFTDERSFHWIASDGGLLERPVELRSLRLAPGERAELLVDFSDGRAVTLETEPDGNHPMMGMMGMMQGAADSSRRHTVLRFVPASRGNAAQRPVPDRLVAIEHVDAASAVRRRRLVLTMGMGMRGRGRGSMGGGMMGGGMMGGGMMGGEMGGRMGDMMAHGIDGRAFDMNRVDQRVRLGDVEIWEVSGEMMAHPIHVHGVQFEVLSRGGRRPDVRDQGLRDTVLVQEPVELLVRFTQPTLDHPFMYHCHILEHEDNGMMGQFAVV